MLLRMSEQRRLKNGPVAVDKGRFGSMAGGGGGPADITAQIDALGLKIRQARAEADARVAAPAVPMSSSRRSTMVAGGVVGLALAGMASGVAIAASPPGHAGSTAGGAPATHPTGDAGQTATSDSVQGTSSTSPIGYTEPSASATGAPATGLSPVGGAPLGAHLASSSSPGPTTANSGAGTPLADSVSASARPTASGFSLVSFTPAIWAPMTAPAGVTPATSLTTGPLTPGLSAIRPAVQAGPPPQMPVTLQGPAGANGGSAGGLKTPVTALTGQPGGATVNPTLFVTSPRVPTATVTKTPSSTPTWTAPTYRAPKVTSPNLQPTTWTSPTWKKPAPRKTAPKRNAAVRKH